MSASSLSLPIFLRINFLISYLDSNRLTEHIRLTHTESFAEWQKAGAGRTSRAFKHPGHDVTAPDVWPSILTDYTYDSELDNADGVPLAFRRSSMFPEGNNVLLCCEDLDYPSKSPFKPQIIKQRTHQYSVAMTTSAICHFKFYAYCIMGDLESINTLNQNERTKM